MYSELQLAPIGPYYTPSAQPDTSNYQVYGEIADLIGTSLKNRRYKKVFNEFIGGLQGEVPTAKEFTKFATANPKIAAHYLPMVEASWTIQKDQNAEARAQAKQAMEMFDIEAQQIYTLSRKLQTVPENSRGQVIETWARSLAESGHPQLKEIARKGVGFFMAPDENDEMSFNVSDDRIKSVMTVTATQGILTHEAGQMRENLKLMSEDARDFTMFMTMAARNPAMSGMNLLEAYQQFKLGETPEQPVTDAAFNSGAMGQIGDSLGMAGGLQGGDPNEIMGGGAPPAQAGPPAPPQGQPPQAGAPQPSLPPPQPMAGPPPDPAAQAQMNAEAGGMAGMIGAPAPVPSAPQPVDPAMAAQRQTDAEAGGLAGMVGAPPAEEIASMFASAGIDPNTPVSALNENDMKKIEKVVSGGDSFQKKDSGAQLTASGNVPGTKPAQNKPKNRAEVQARMQQIKQDEQTPKSDSPPQGAAVKVSKALNAMVGDPKVASKTVDRLQKHEGFEAQPYELDGRTNIGYGFKYPLSEDQKKVIGKEGQDVQSLTEAEATKLLNFNAMKLYRQAKSEIKKKDGYDIDTLPPDTKGLFMELAYINGGKGLSEYEQMIRAVFEGDYVRGKKEMNNSKMVREGEAHKERVDEWNRIWDDLISKHQRTGRA